MHLNFKQFGESGSLVLLIHGLFGSLENLGVLSRVLSQHHRVYALDLPEHGKSPHTDSTSVFRLSEQVKNWLDAENLSSFALVGHSLGGKVAMELALKFPEQVSHLAVLDIAPVSYPSHHGQIFSGLLALKPDALKNRAEADKQLSEFIPDSAVRSFLLKNLEKKGDAYAWRMNLPVLHRDYAELIQGNSEGIYQGPSLFLKGGASDYIQPDYHPAIYSRFPDAEIGEVLNAGHWLHAEQPQKVVEQLQRFLAV